MKTVLALIILSSMACSNSQAQTETLRPFEKQADILVEEHGFTYQKITFLQNSYVSMYDHLHYFDDVSLVMYFRTEQGGQVVRFSLEEQIHNLVKNHGFTMEELGSYSRREVVIMSLFYVSMYDHLIPSRCGDGIYFDDVSLHPGA